MIQLMKYKGQVMGKSTTYDKTCPVCGGSGYELKLVVNDETRRVYGETPMEVAAPCSRCNGGYAERVREIRKYSNIPMSFYDSDLSKFKWDIYKDETGKPIESFKVKDSGNNLKVIQVSKLKKVIETFIDKFDIWEKRGVGLYIYSKMKGSGKTFLASCICNSLNAKYRIITKFVSVSALIDLSKRSENGRDIIETLCNTRLLCLDDLGQKQSGNEWLNDILFRLTDARMQKGLLTIITSNVRMQDLKMDDRIVDRINKITTPIPLPDYCIRSEESKKVQKELFRELGI